MGRECRRAAYSRLGEVALHCSVLVAAATALVVVSCGATEEAAEDPMPATSSRSSSTVTPTRVPTAVPTPTPDLVDLVGPQPISVYAGTGGPGFSGDRGPADEAAIFAPLGLALDTEGNLFIATDNRVRRVDARTHTVETVAGTGSPGYTGEGRDATTSKLRVPRGIAVDAVGNLYIADHDNGRVRKVDTSGVLMTVAGGGVPTRTGGVLETGDGGPATDAWFQHVTDVDVDAEGNIYFLADNRLRKVDTAGVLSTLAGTGLRGNGGDDGPGIDATLASPLGLAVDRDGWHIYIADTDNHRIRRLDMASGIITTIAGLGDPSMGARLHPMYADTGSRRGGSGAGFEGDGGPAVNAKLDDPSSVAVGPNGNVFVADTDNNRIRMIDIETGVISTVADGGLVEGRVPDSDPISAGNRTYSYAYFAKPRGIAVNDVGYVFAADTKHNKVVVVQP